MKKLLLLTCILLCAGCGSKARNNAKTEKVETLTVEELVLQYAQKYADSIANARNLCRLNLGYILPEWWRDIEQNSKNRNTPMELVQSGYSIFEYYATASAWNKQLKEQGYDIPDADLEQDQKFRAMQPTVFPGLRQSFAKACKEKYWIDDIDVTISGSKNQYIHFTAAQFATNKNIKAFNDNIYFTAYVLRFAQVRYSWYKGGDYEYFNIYEGKDNDPIPTILDDNYMWGDFPNAF